MRPRHHLRVCEGKGRIRGIEEKEKLEVVSQRTSGTGGKLPKTPFRSKRKKNRRRKRERREKKRVVSSGSW